MFQRLLCTLLIVAPLGAVSAAADEPSGPNVLFIAIDDLND